MSFSSAMMVFLAKLGLERIAELSSNGLQLAFHTDEIITAEDEAHISSCKLLRTRPPPLK
jgi:hypothetical protein